MTRHEAVGGKIPLGGHLAYTGQRRSYDGALGTVRYVGPLPGLEGSWLGIEWDDPGRGKHSGTFKGEQIFKTLNVSTATAGSFIRASRIADPSRTLLQAIKYKYAGPVEAGLHASTDSRVPRIPNSAPIEISGKLVEEVGFQKIREKQAALERLQIVLVDELCVRGLTEPEPSPEEVQTAQEELLATCPNIVELDIGWNLIERWQDVADICAALPQLRVLKASGMRLTSFETKHYELADLPFRNINELQLNENLLLPDQLWQILWHQECSQLPSLKTLSLSQNALQNLGGLEASQLHTLENLILERNSFETLEVLWEVAAKFPNVNNVSLQSNLVCDVHRRSHTLDAALTAIQTLNLADNHISSYTFIDKLAPLLPRLTSLRISHNPLYEEHAMRSKRQLNAAFCLTLARIPSLKMLNYTTISERDREEGEIYYISTTSAHLASLLAQKPLNDITSQYTLYTTLCTKHDREPIWTTLHQLSLQPTNPMPFAPGTLGARLVNATFYLLNSSALELTRPIPKTISVYTLKAQLARTFHLQPLQFRLIYESEELDPVRDDLYSTTRDWERWGDWDVDDDDNEDDDDGDAGQVHVGDGDDGTVYKDGKKWKKREVEIVDGTRAWGDLIDRDVSDVRVRIESFDKALSR